MKHSRSLNYHLTSVGHDVKICTVPFNLRDSTFCLSLIRRYPKGFQLTTLPFTTLARFQINTVKMQNTWDRNDTVYSNDKIQVPYQDGYTTPARDITYLQPDAMSTVGRKSVGGAYSVDGTISQLGYGTPSFSSQTIVPHEATSSDKPSIPRLCLRIWQVISSAATFAFQAAGPAVDINFVFVHFWFPIVRWLRLNVIRRLQEWTFRSNQRFNTLSLESPFYLSCGAPS
jgi:hypothetical protein